MMWHLDVGEALEDLKKVIFHSGRPRRLIGSRVIDEIGGEDLVNDNHISLMQDSLEESAKQSFVFLLCPGVVHI